MGKNVNIKELASLLFKSAKYHGHCLIIVLP